jgi:hypothetical protein
MNCLMWSVFSLLLRSTPELEHIIVAINGADERTGDPSLQNRKQWFLEDLRDLKWKLPSQGIERDMPLTIIRVWSRIGHSQAIEMAVPWVHTSMYTLSHDDVIVLDKQWSLKTSRAFQDDHCGLVYAPPLLATGLSYVEFNGSHKINLPHLNSTFLTVRKSTISEFGVRWSGYHVTTDDFSMKDINYEEFLQFHGDAVAHAPPQDLDYKYISMDVGTHVYYELKKAGYKLIPMNEGDICHLTAMSWRDDNGKRQAVSANAGHIAALEEEIRAVPEYAALYDQYKSDTL